MKKNITKCWYLKDYLKNAHDFEKKCWFATTHEFRDLIKRWLLIHGPNYLFIKSLINFKFGNINPNMHEVYGAFCLFLFKDRVRDDENVYNT